MDTKTSHDSYDQDAPADPSTPPPRSTLRSTATLVWSRISPVTHPIGWLATCGSALVLTAAVSSTTAGWEDVPIVLRLAGIVILTALTVAFAERSRSSLPASARVLAHLGAGLALPTAVSAAATAQQSWRTCTLVGGIAGIAALELQSRRWRSWHMRSAEVAAACVGAAGAAALTQSPIGVIIGALAVCALLIRWNWRAAWLAGAAASSPALALLAAVRFGPGTIAELGASGSTLVWAAPTAGAIAAAVFCAVALRHRTRKLPLLCAAAASLLINVGIGTAAAPGHSGWPLAWTTLAAAASLAGLTRNRRLGMVVAIVFPVMLSGQMEMLNTETFPMIAGLTVLGLAAIGASQTLHRGFTPIDAIGFSALFTAAGSVHSPVRQCAFGIAVSILAIGYGKLMAHKALQVVGAVGAVAWGVGLASQADYGLIVQYKTDIIALSFIAIIAMFEAWARRYDAATEGVSPHGRTQFLGSSLAGATYLIAGAMITGSTLRLGVAFGVGLVAVGIGTLSNRTPLTVVGAIVSASALAIATREQLASLPLWMWCLIGGLGLIALAIGVERRRGSGPAAGNAEI